MQTLFRWSPPDNQAAFGCTLFGQRHPMNYSHMGIWTGAAFKVCVKGGRPRGAVLRDTCGGPRARSLSRACRPPAQQLSHETWWQSAGSIPGNLGVVNIPGSDRVLDRSTNTLVSCNRIRCPLSTW